MPSDARNAWAQVLWIGGAPDAGKSTVAAILAEHHDLVLYNCDRADEAHHRRLAQIMPEYDEFLSASLDERWVQPTPEQLFARAVRSFAARFPLLTEDLCELGRAKTILVEGFSVTPGLVEPLLLSPRQAIWLIPTAQFKKASVERRNKPSFRFATGDPERVRSNLLARDALLCAYIREQAESRNLTVLEVDGSSTTEELATLIASHFAPWLNSRE